MSLTLRLCVRVVTKPFDNIPIFSEPLSTPFFFRFKVDEVMNFLIVLISSL